MAEKKTAEINAERQAAAALKSAASKAAEKIAAALAGHGAYTLADVAALQPLASDYVAPAPAGGE